VLADVAPAHYAEILQAVIVAVEGRKAPISKLSETLRLSLGQTNSLFAAAMLCVSVIGESGNADEFMQVTSSAGVIREEAASKVRPFVETIVSQQPQIGRTIRRASLPAQVLPAISNFEVVIDLRLAFDDGAVTDSVPVALLHVDTDAEVEELWFQASREQLQQMRNDIDGALRKMDAAEAWGKREPKG
jgi:hypothetical protein